MKKYELVVIVMLVMAAFTLMTACGSESNSEAFIIQPEPSPTVTILPMPEPTATIQPDPTPTKPPKGYKRTYLVRINLTDDSMWPHIQKWFRHLPASLVTYTIEQEPCNDQNLL